MLKLELFSCRIGQEQLMEENLLDDDIEAELAPVVVQLGYVQQVLSDIMLAFFVFSLC